MGQSINNSIQSLFNKKRKKVFIFGLDNSGKSTILYQLDKNIQYNMIAIALNTEDGIYNNLDLTAVDTYASRPRYNLLRQCFSKCEGMIYVVDSNDHDSFNEAVEDFKLIITNETIKSVPILVFANKQDFKNSKTPIEITNLLEIKDLVKTPWLVQGSSAINGNGIKDGLKWLSAELS